MEKDRIEHRGLRLAQVYFGMTSSQQLYFAHNCDELSRLILSLQEMGKISLGGVMYNLERLGSSTLAIGQARLFSLALPEMILLFSLSFVQFLCLINGARLITRGRMWLIVTS